MTKPARKSSRSASVAVHRGNLGIHFDRGSQDFTAEKNVSLIDGQCFEIELDHLFDVDDSLFKRRPLRLAAFQLRKPGVETARVFFNDDSCLAGHMISLRPW